MEEIRSIVDDKLENFVRSEAFQSVEKEVGHLKRSQLDPLDTVYSVGKGISFPRVLTLNARFLTDTEGGVFNV
jgi:hypothetical protein